MYPNNDHGSEYILAAYDKLKQCNRIELVPSLRFEYVLSFLKHADFLIANSSVGLHETPIYGLPAIHIGTRQQNRFRCDRIFDVDFIKTHILEQIGMIKTHSRYASYDFYGDGTSADKFMQALNDKLWNISNQKQFKDLI